MLVWIADISATDGSTCQCGLLLKAPPFRKQLQHTECTKKIHSWLCHQELDMEFEKRSRFANVRYEYHPYEDCAAELLPFSELRVNKPGTRKGRLRLNQLPIHHDTFGLVVNCLDWQLGELSTAQIGNFMVFIQSLPTYCDRIHRGSESLLNMYKQLHK